MIGVVGKRYEKRNDHLCRSTSLKHTNITRSVPLNTALPLIAHVVQSVGLQIGIIVDILVNKCTHES